MNPINWTKWSAVAEVFSSIAIVVTLIYLAVQSQQTNSMLLGNSRQAMMEADLDYLRLAADYPEANANIVPMQSSTRREFSMLSTFMRSREFAWFQYRNGVMDEATFETYMTSVGPMLSGEIGSRWWINFSGSVDPDFAEYVKQLLEERGLPGAPE